MALQIITSRHSVCRWTITTRSVPSLKHQCNAGVPIGQCWRRRRYDYRPTLGLLLLYPTLRRGWPVHVHPRGYPGGAAAAAALQADLTANGHFANYPGALTTFGRQNYPQPRLSAFAALACGKSSRNSPTIPTKRSTIPPLRSTRDRSHPCKSPTAGIVKLAADSVPGLVGNARMRATRNFRIQDRNPRSVSAKNERTQKRRKDHPCPVAIETLRTYSSNIGTWRWSSVGPRRGRRVAPITARTDRDSRAVRGTKMRWVFERWSGGLTR